MDIYDATTDTRIYGFCALTDSASLNKIWFAVPQGTAPPASVYIVIRDRLCSANYVSNTVATPAPPPPGPIARSVTRVNRDSRGRTTHLCGSWGKVTATQAIAQIEAGTHSYRTWRRGRTARIGVVRTRWGKYLRSYGSRWLGNNLNNLPPCP